MSLNTEWAELASRRIFELDYATNDRLRSMKEKHGERFFDQLNVSSRGPADVRSHVQKMFIEDIVVGEVVRILFEGAQMRLDALCPLDVEAKITTGDTDGSPRVKRSP